MQDIPNPHLEVESREPALVVKSNDLEANRAATMLGLAPSSSDLGCGCALLCIEAGLLDEAWRFPKIH